MKFTVFIIALGIAGFAAGFFPRQSPPVANPSPAKTASTRLESTLRDGDSARAMESLRKLAEEDPRAFFKELNRFPALDGMVEMVATAARRLAAENPQDAADLLNRISNLGLRAAAWAQFVNSLPGLSPLEKIDIARLAQPSAELATYSTVVAQGLVDDPEGTLRILRTPGYTDAYCWALKNLGGTRPADVVAHLKGDLASGLLKPTDCQSVLQSMALQNQTPEALKSIVGLVKDYGWSEGLYAGPIFSPAFQLAAAEEKAGVLDSIATLPAVQKNFVLSQLPLAEVDPAVTARVINMMDSTELQVAALKQLKDSGADAAKIATISALLGSERTRSQWQAAMNGSDP